MSNEQPSEQGVWSDRDTVAFIDYGDVFVPQRAEQLRIVQELVKESVVERAGGVIVDLGCGEGRMAAGLLAAYQSLEVIAVDSSPEMLGKATQSLRQYGTRSRVVQSDLREFGAQVPRGLTGVVSSLAIHHLEDDEKSRLFREIFDILAAGGCFVLADLTMPATKAGRRVAAWQWDEAVKTRADEIGKPEAFAHFARVHWNNFSDPEPDDVDKPSSVEDQLRWLRAVGFRSCDVVWMHAGHAILFAVK